jgi:molybdate transport system permease protein
VDWPALQLSLWLGLWTVVVLVPLAVLAGRPLAFRRFPGKGFVEALIALPLVLPPTVLGFYILVVLAPGTALGDLTIRLLGGPLVFTFEGLLLASVIFNIPFAVQPIQRAFAGIPRNLREAAWVSGLSPLATFLRIELPLAWPGIVAATALTLAHTLGEFGVVLMVGGNIPGETRTVAIAIYDRVQLFDYAGAALMSGLLLLLSFLAIGLVHLAGDRLLSRHD